MDNSEANITKIEEKEENISRLLEEIKESVDRMSKLIAEAKKNFNDYGEKEQEQK